MNKLFLFPISLFLVNACFAEATATASAVGTALGKNPQLLEDRSASIAKQPRTQRKKATLKEKRSIAETETANKRQFLEKAAVANTKRAQGKKSSTAQKQPPTQSVESKQAASDIEGAQEKKSSTAQKQLPTQLPSQSVESKQAAFDIEGVQGKKSSTSQTQSVKKSPGKASTKAPSTSVKSKPPINSDKRRSPPLTPEVKRTESEPVITTQEEPKKAPSPVVEKTLPNIPEEKKPLAEKQMPSFPIEDDLSMLDGAGVSESNDRNVFTERKRPRLKRPAAQLEMLQKDRIVQLSHNKETSTSYDRHISRQNHSALSQEETNLHE